MQGIHMDQCPPPPSSPAGLLVQPPESRSRTAVCRKFALLDETVFKKTSSALGGRVRGIVSGAAPLARHVEDFLKATMGCPVMQVSLAACSSCGRSDGHKGTQWLTWSRGTGALAGNAPPEGRG